MLDSCGSCCLWEKNKTPDLDWRVSLLSGHSGLKNLVARSQLFKLFGLEVQAVSLGVEEMRLQTRIFWFDAFSDLVLQFSCILKDLWLGHYMIHHWLPFPSVLSWTSWWHMVVLWLCWLPASGFECGRYASVQWKAQRTVKFLKVPKGSLKPYSQWIETLQYTDQEAGADLNHSNHKEKKPKHAETYYPNTKSMRDQLSLGLLLIEVLAWQRKQGCSQIRNKWVEKISGLPATIWQ